MKTKLENKKELGLPVEPVGLVKSDRLRLTKSQEALIEVLKEPKSALLDVSEICKLANVTRATYYNAFKTDDFIKALEVEYQTLRATQEFAVLHTLIAKAKEGVNHHWAKMFFEMQGRLDSAAHKPAQIIVHFNVQRPKVEAKAENIIEITAESVED